MCVSDLSRFIRDGLGFRVNDGNFFSGDLRLLSRKRVWNGDHLSLDNRRLRRDTQHLMTQLHNRWLHTTGPQFIAQDIFGRTNADKQKKKLRTDFGFFDLQQCWSNTHMTPSDTQLCSFTVIYSVEVIWFVCALKYCFIFRAGDSTWIRWIRFTCVCINLLHILNCDVYWLFTHGSSIRHGSTTIITSQINNTTSVLHYMKHATHPHLL